MSVCKIPGRAGAAPEPCFDVGDAAETEILVGEVEVVAEGNGAIAREEVVEGGGRVGGAEGVFDEF